MTSVVTGLEALETNPKMRRLENRTPSLISFLVVSVSLLFGPQIEWELVA